MAPDLFADGPDPGDPEVERLRQDFTDQLAIRTRFYDDYLLDSVAGGCTQVVLLGVGLDTRVFRLAWPRSVRAFELDLPAVLSFKQAVLDAERANALCTRVPVAVDLSEDWSRSLLDAGFDPDVPTAWTAEGLLSYLTNEQSETLLLRASRLSARASRIAVEAARIDDDATLVQARSLDSLAPIAAMWQGGLSEEPGTWFEAHGWDVEWHDRVRLATRYGRPIRDSSTGGYLIALPVCRVTHATRRSLRG